MKIIIAQIIGFIALGLLVILFQKDNRSIMLRLMLVAAALFSVHFLLLGAFTGAAMNGLNVLRSYVFERRNNKKWAKAWWWPFVFVAAVIVLGLVTWGGYRSIFVIIAVSTQTAAFWMNNTRKIRLISLISPPCWFVYNIIVGSVPGMLTEVMILGSLLVGIYRFDISSKTPKIRLGRYS